MAKALEKNHQVAEATRVRGEAKKPGYKIGDCIKTTPAQRIMGSGINHGLMAPQNAALNQHIGEQRAKVTIEHHMAAEGAQPYTNPRCIAPNCI